MQTFDLDAFWHTTSQVSGLQTSEPAAFVHAPKSLPHEGYTSSGVDGRTDNQAQTAASIDDLAALQMPDLTSTKSAQSAYNLRDLMQRHDAGFKSFDTTAAVWLSMGFITGMIAWHSVGFWGFVTEAVLYPRDRNSAISANAQTPVARRQLAPTVTPPLTTGSLPDKSGLEQSACVALSIDRVSSQTQAGACSGDLKQLRDAGYRQRGNRLPDLRERLQAPQSWAAEAQSAPDTPVTSAEAAIPQDFDLTLTPK
jgi:hypothetical protein